METAVQLQKNFLYPIGPLLLLTVLFLLMTFVVMKWIRQYVRKYNETAKLSEQMTHSDFVAPARQISPRAEYLGRLEQLERAVMKKEVSQRDCYQMCSQYLREFVTKETGYDVTTCTLMELEQLKMPALTQLIRYCYEPEFSKESCGDSGEVIEKTKRVIEQWK